MPLQKNVKLPPLTQSHRQRKHTDYKSEEGHKKEESQGAFSVQPSMAKKLGRTGSSYVYAFPERKPHFLKDLENYVDQELSAISPCEPKYQELKLQVYRDVFSCFIKEFKTYQPILSAIKQEYENTLVCHQNDICEVERLRSDLRLVTEECDRKTQACWGEAQAEITTLKREKQKLQEAMEAMREKEMAMQALVDRLQLDLTNQYLQYREERDARKLLLSKVNELKNCLLKQESPRDENTIESEASLKLQLALKVCREDLTKAQQELVRIKAEYWDVVPRCDWDSLEQAHKQTLVQLKTLQGDFDQLKKKYETLQELCNTDGLQMTHHSVTLQMGENVSHQQTPLESSQPKQLISSDPPEGAALTVQEFSAALTMAFPVRSHPAIDDPVPSAQSEVDLGSSQRLSSPIPESGAAALPPAADGAEENDGFHLKATQTTSDNPKNVL